jgi:N4-acetylcytidine amidohydrolase
LKGDGHINAENENELPPKTCTIDRLITLQPDIDKVLAGVKTATRRNGRYADVGEVMTLQGKQYIIERVYSQSLGELSDEDARREGHSNVEEYKQSILSFHPGMPWLPQMRVWVHEFGPATE